MTAEIALERSVTRRRSSTFADWRRRCDREHIAPVVAVAGSRGKTSVIRAVESIFKAERLRYASWTNRGVEIEGEGQRGELGPWSRTLTRLRAGGLDIALHELDWATVQAIGAPEDTFPVVAITNLCGNNDACLATPETLSARRALERFKGSIGESGRLVINAHDLALADDTAFETPGRVLIATSSEVPLMRKHLLRGGDACFVENSVIVMQESNCSTPVIELSRLGWIRDGSIQFAVQNALFAAAIARACGISTLAVATGLSQHRARPESMPGSFNIFDINAATVIIDRPMPSWFLRSALRAASNLGNGRQIRIVGPMNGLASHDLVEIGRLMGRQSGIVIVHGEWDTRRFSLIRQGAATNAVPPLVVQAPDERFAIRQGLEMLRAGDVMFVLAENAPAAVRQVASRTRNDARPAAESFGAA